MVLPAVERCGVLHALRRLDREPTEVCLNYHNVGTEEFRAHAAYLRRHAEVLDLETFIRPTRAPTARVVTTLTFDDGYASFVDRILPILREFGLPATWFVATALVGTRELFWFDRVRLAVLSSPRDRVELDGRRWPLASSHRGSVATAITTFIKRTPRSAQPRLVDAVIAQLGEAPAAAYDTCRLASPDQIRAAHRMAITIGSHSHTHPQLSQLEPDELFAELTTSKRLLEQWTGAEVRHFAFPSGDYDAAVLDAIGRAGYASAWTTEPRHRTRADRIDALPRVSIDDRASTAVLSARMTRLLAGW